MEPQFVFFYKINEPNGYFSQWYISPMTIDGVEYNCCEQYMMAEKARLFNDMPTRARILATDSPIMMKKLGRAVVGFDQAQWDEACLGIVTEANYHKFSQNPVLMEQLLATGNATIVEASPLDRIWGIGVDKNHPSARDPAQWRGRNLLGVAIMQARERLRMFVV